MAEYDITCSVCGNLDTVKFKPEHNDVLCKDCNTLYKRARYDRTPRKKHGTRVSFPIDCVACGKHEVLTYIPRGRSLDQMLCTECVSRTVSPESKWARQHQEISREHQTSWKVDCGECGKRIYLTDRPKRGRDYFCSTCYNDHIIPSEENILAGTDSLGDDLRIRKKTAREPKAYAPPQDTPAVHQEGSEQE